MLQLKFESGQRISSDGAKRQIVPMVDGARKNENLLVFKRTGGFMRVYG